MKEMTDDPLAARFREGRHQVSNDLMGHDRVLINFTVSVQQVKSTRN